MLHGHRQLYNFIARFDTSNYELDRPLDWELAAKIMKKFAALRAKTKIFNREQQQR